MNKSFLVGVRYKGTEYCKMMQPYLPPEPPAPKGDPPAPVRPYIFTPRPLYSPLYQVCINTPLIYQSSRRKGFNNPYYHHCSFVFSLSLFESCTPHPLIFSPFISSLLISPPLISPSPHSLSLSQEKARGKKPLPRNAPSSQPRA